MRRLFRCLIGPPSSRASEGCDIDTDAQMFFFQMCPVDLLREIKQREALNRSMRNLKREGGRKRESQESCDPRVECDFAHVLGPWAMIC